MKNSELYSPACPDERAKALVMAGPLRGVVDKQGSYAQNSLLDAQVKVFREWREAARGDGVPDFDCDFYEWMERRADAAFLVRPGQLVKYGGKYGVVAARIEKGLGWAARYAVRRACLVHEKWPQPMNAVIVKTADGLERSTNALDLEPADFPPEVFALACGRAKDCPMLKGGRDGE